MVSRFLLLLALVTSLVLVDPLARSAAIINGPVVDPAPSWAAALVVEEGPTCSGALVAPNLVITARHCVRPSHAPMEIVIGRSDINKEAQGARARIAHSIDHPTEDLALQVLDRSVNLAPLALGSGDPSSDPMSFLPFTAYGYGETNDFNEPSRADGLLRSAVGEVVSCPAAFSVSPPEFCLKAPKQSPICHGDSGAPLVASNQLMGIVSAMYYGAMGRRCVVGFWSAVSVPHSAIKPWVEGVISANSPS